MHYSIVHETPGRIRLGLILPKFPLVDLASVEAHFSDMTGVKKVSFSPRTRRLLVLYDRKPVTRESILARIEAAPLPRSQHPRPRTDLERKKKTVIRSGTLLLARPLIPPPVRPILAIYGAIPIFKKGLVALRRGEVNVDVLDASAVGAAMGTKDFVTASIISFLLKLGDYLEEWTRGYSRRLLTEMFHTGEEWAWVEREGEELRLPLEELIVGDTVIARTGSLIPVDGVVLDGEALVNQASLTGESLAVAKRPGSSVYAGTAVEEGVLRIRADRVGDETKAARVVKVIEEGEALKAETQSRSEAMADRIVPYSFLASGLTYALTGNAGRAAAVLLVDYSCAIKLSTPLAILTSLARSARHRVLIKGGKHLENLARADAFVLDKTGTLTEASPKVAEVIPFGDYDRAAVLRIAACVEEHFPHPVATSVVRQAEQEGLPHPEKHSEVEYVVAHGIASWLEGERVVIGSRHFVYEDEGVDVAMGESYIDTFAGRGDSVLYMGIGGKLAGLIAIHDPLRQDAAPFIDGLRQAGVKKIVMLTGDNTATAATIAERLGIDEFHAQALPDRKVEVIDGLRKEGYTVAMVGDGINDSPALARADVGISMKHGADIAQEACDILLMEGDLSDILTARRISREAMALVEQNFRTIVTVNTGAMLLAMMGTIPPVFSATIHNLSTILVGLRALGPLRRGNSNALTEF